MPAGDPKILSPEELSEVERLWILHAQRQLGSEGSFSVWQRQFQLFMDERGVLRCGGRLTNADLLYATKHPVFLPRKHPLTKLIVLESHARVGHNKERETLTDIRAKYWIVKGRSLVKSIVHCCVTCRRYEGTPYRAPPPPPLPTFRNPLSPTLVWTMQDRSTSLFLEQPTPLRRGSVSSLV